MAFASRFCVFRIKNIMRNVTTFVPVLITSCHVSEKRKTGPVAHHTTMTATATKNDQAEPTTSDVRDANLRNRSFMAQALLRSRLQHSREGAGPQHAQNSHSQRVH